MNKEVILAAAIRSSSEGGKEDKRPKVCVITSKHLT